jgi:hypothetical protein
VKFCHLKFIALYCIRQFRSFLIRTSSIRIITSARDPGTCDQHIFENKVATTSTTAQDVVIGRIRSRRPFNIPEKKVGNDDAIGRATSWSSIQIILLNINTVRLDPADGNIAICDV